jgi:ComF family protein
MWKTFVKEILDIFFPIRCINCQKEGDYLCDDCLSLIEISKFQYCPFCRPPKITKDGKSCKVHKKHLDGLFSAASYKEALVKKAIHLFKYQPNLLGLAEPLSSLIISHLDFLGNKHLSGFVLVAIPIHKSKLKQRGFNQSEEIAKELSKKINGTLFLKDALLKIKKTPPQRELKRKEREKNIKGVFVVNPKKLDFIKNKKVLLVDDVFTTGSTMEEAAKVLKKAGAKKVFGVVIARE